MLFSITDSVAITKSIADDLKVTIWKQLLIAFSVSIPFFTQGVQTLALSTSAHAGHFMVSSGEVAWTTTAMVIAAVLSAPVYCCVLDRFGRKKAIFILNTMQLISFFPLFVSQSDTTRMALHIIAGCTSSGLFIVIPTYIREISHTSIRGVNLSFILVMTTAGYLTNLVIDFDSVIYVTVPLVVLQIIISLCLLESPGYLVMMGNIEAARQNIAKIRCREVPEPMVSRATNSFIKEIERARANGNLTLWTILKNPIYRDLTKIGMVLHTSLILGGSLLFMDQEKVLQQLNMDIPWENALILGCLFGGSLLTMTVIRFTSRKVLIVSAFTIMLLAMGLIAIFTQTNLIVEPSLRWMPISALGIIVFGYGMIWGMPAFIMAEVLNIGIRATILSFVFVYSQILKLVHIYTYQYIEDFMGIYALFFIFAIINMFGGIYTLFLLPEIKGKSAKQVERQLKRVPLLVFITTDTTKV